MKSKVSSSLYRSVILLHLVIVIQGKDFTEMCMAGPKRAFCGLLWVRIGRNIKGNTKERKYKEAKVGKVDTNQ